MLRLCCISGPLTPCCEADAAALATVLTLLCVDLFGRVGTSTGSILAAFLTTKGGACEEAFLNPSDAQLKDCYRDSMMQFKAAKGMEHSTYISPGQWMVVTPTDKAGAC